MYVWKDFVETNYPIDPFNSINNRQASKPTCKQTWYPINQQIYILGLKSSKRGCGTLKDKES